MTTGTETRFHWTPERIQTLVDMHGQGVPYREIAEALGCLESSAQDKCHKMGLTKRITPWTPEEEATLKRLRKGGLTWPAIAREMGLRKTQVIGKAKYLGLTGKREPEEVAPPPKPEPVKRSNAPRGHSIVTAAGCTFRRDDAGRVALHENDKAFRQHFDRRLT